MNHKRLWVAAAIIALILLVGFMLSAPHTHDVSGTTTSQTATTSVSAIKLHDVFKKGMHTITGSINAPNACADVTAQATLSAENIVVALSLPEDTGVCLQLPTQVNFSTTISAPAHTPITATVNGSSATTSVI